MREFQQGLAQRLREAETEGEPSWRLGGQGGSRNWLLKLDDAGEMLPLPEFSSVPLTKPWYLGLANLRGVLASIVDFAAFMGGEQTVRTPDCRLLLVAERFHSFSGLLISRMLGLKNVQAMQLAEEATDRSWIGAAYRDEDGRLWHELDIGALVAHDDFLQVGAWHPSTVPRTQEALRAFPRLPAKMETKKGAPPATQAPRAIPRAVPKPAGSLWVPAWRASRLSLLPSWPEV